MAAHPAGSLPWRGWRRPPRRPPARQRPRPAPTAHGRRRLPEHLPRHRTEYHPAPGDRGVGNAAATSSASAKTSVNNSSMCRLAFSCVCTRGSSTPVRSAKATWSAVRCRFSRSAKVCQGRDRWPGHVLTSKYNDHLPLNRLEGILQRQGVELSRSTLCDWVAASARLLEPLVGVMKTEVLASRKIHTDDTTVPVLDKSRESTKNRASVGVCRRLYPRAHRLRLHAGSKPRRPFAVFPRRIQGLPPGRCVRGLRCSVRAGQEVVEVACWAHARRKFFDAMKSDPARSQISLASIRELYSTEKRGRLLGEAERRDLRLAEAKPQC